MLAIGGPHWLFIQFLYTDTILCESTIVMETVDCVLEIHTVGKTDIRPYVGNNSHSKMTMHVNIL